MEQYLNIDHDSGVMAYEIGPDFIRVQFKDGWVYEYTNSSVGTHNLDIMKSLARNGDGLNSFINKNVKKRYTHKWH